MVGDCSSFVLRERAINLLKARGLKSQSERLYCWDWEERMMEVLKGQPVQMARQFLIEFYGTAQGETGDYFPNGAELGQYIGDLVFIPWFKPEREYSASDLEVSVGKISETLNLDIQGVNLTDDKRLAEDASCNSDWRSAKVQVYDTINTAIKYNHRDRILAELHAGTGARAAAYDLCSLNLGARLIPVQDIPEVRAAYPENPFKALMKVYSKGLWPAGIRERKLVVYHPEVRKQAAA